MPQVLQIGSAQPRARGSHEMHIGCAHGFGLMSGDVRSCCAGSSILHFRVSRDRHAFGSQQFAPLFSGRVPLAAFCPSRHCRDASGNDAELPRSSLRSRHARGFDGFLRWQAGGMTAQDSRAAVGVLCRRDSCEGVGRGRLQPVRRERIARDALPLSHSLRTRVRHFSDRRCAVRAHVAQMDHVRLALSLPGFPRFGLSRFAFRSVLSFQRLASARLSVRLRARPRI